MLSRTLPNPDHRNHLTRRAALHGAAAVGALALPAGALATELPTGADAHLAWWRERQELKRRADAMIVPEDEDSEAQAALWSQQWEFDHLILETAPTTALGAVVVAATLLASRAEVGPALNEGSRWEDAGQTLANYILEQAPVELRARLEV